MRDTIATAEHRAIREAARDVFTARADWQKRWNTLAELGWLGMSVPEELGGAGLGLQEEIIMFEEAARTLSDVPLLSTLGLALPIFAAAHDDAALAGIAAGDVVATLAWAESAGPWTLRDAASGGSTFVRDGALTGVKRWVLDCDRGGRIAVIARGNPQPIIASVASDDVTVQSIDSSDVTRTLGEISFTATPARMLAAGHDVKTTLELVWRRAMTLAAAEAVGVTRRMLDDSAAYATTRVQFGKPIGAYQAVSHKVADLYVALALARALVRDAAAAVDDGGAAASAAVAAAAAKAIPAAVRACEDTIQIYGGLGMTWESSLHRYYKRALSLAALDGPAWHHRAAFAEVTFAERPPWGSPPVRCAQSKPTRYSKPEMDSASRSHEAG